MTPAEELDSTDRQRMVQNAENIGNESLLINFYKKKLDDQKNDVSSKHTESQNITHRVSAPLKARDENKGKEIDHSSLNSIYLQSSSQRNISGYIPKQYQIPIKKGNGKSELKVKSAHESSSNPKKYHKKHVK